MSNHIYANGAIHNDYHKEINFHGNLTEQQTEMVLKNFLSDNTKEKEQVEEAEFVADEEKTAGDEEKTAGDEEKTAGDEEKTAGDEEKTAGGEDDEEKELFYFLHPALEDEEAWKVHREVERLVKRFDIQQICSYLSALANEKKLLLPQNVKTAYNELVRMGMPEKKSGFSYKNFEKFYHK